MEPIRLLELLFFEFKINKHELKSEPIFILGHWRSGTTRLQHLMSANEEHTTTSVFQFLYSDTFILTEAWLKRPLNWLCTLFRIPYSFQRIPMDLNLPGELESAMCSLGSRYSYTWGHMFPQKHEHWINRMIELENPKDVERWLDDYEYLIKKFSYASKGKRMIIKSPGDTGRLDFLMKRFPNAKFVYIDRDPIDVYNSTKYFWKVITKEISFQLINDEQIEQYVLDTYMHVMTHYRKTKQKLTADQLIEIQFQNLSTDPIGVIRNIYNQLELGKFPEEQVKALTQKKKEHRLGKYSNTEIELQRIKEAWGDLTDL